MKMFNRKPCMKCGGKVMKRGGLKKMQTGGTPPNCDIGYTVDPNDPSKCIPIQAFPSNMQSTSPINWGAQTVNPSNIPRITPNITPFTTPIPTNGINPSINPPTSAPQTVTSPTPNPEKNIPIGTGVYAPGFGPYAPKPTPTQPPIPYAGAVNDPSKDPTNPFNPNFNAQKWTEKIITQPAPSSKKQEGCPKGYIFDPKQKKCVKDANMPGWMIWEGLGTLANMASKLVARNRQEDYLNLQLQGLGQRQPIPDWATNEQKQPIGYNLYVKKGGLIKMQYAGGFCTKGSGCSNNSTKDKYKRSLYRGSVEPESTPWENLIGYVNPEVLKQYNNDPYKSASEGMRQRYKTIMNPLNQIVDDKGNYLPGAPKGETENFYKLMTGLQKANIFDPNNPSNENLIEWIKQSEMNDDGKKINSFKDLINKNIYTGLSVPNQTPKYFKTGGSINNNKNNNMINIKKANRGKFTAQAKRAGMGVQEFADYVLGNPDKFTAATMKRANFAKNAAGWKKEYGGTTMYNPYYEQIMMQDGGPMPMQGGMEGQEGGEDQLQQIIMMIVEALQEGMAPEEIIQALVQMGIPEEQAVQLLQAVMEQIQGQAGGMQQGQQMQQAAPMMKPGGSFSLTYDTTKPTDYTASPDYLDRIRRYFEMHPGTRVPTEPVELPPGFVMPKGNMSEIIKRLEETYNKKPVPEEFLPRIPSGDINELMRRIKEKGMPSRKSWEDGINIGPYYPGKTGEGFQRLPLTPPVTPGNWQNEMRPLQQGGFAGGSQGDQISMLVQSYASATNQDPNDVMKQLLSMKSDDEKKAFLIEMQSALAQLNKSGQTQQQGMMGMGGSKYYR